MKPTPLSRTERIYAWMSFLPWVTLGSLLALFAAARWRLGEWPKALHWKTGEWFPTHSNLDPGQLGWLYDFTWAGLALSFLALLIATGFGALSWPSLRRTSKTATIRIMAGTSALLLVMLANPFDLWNWYLD